MTIRRTIGFATATAIVVCASQRARAQSGSMDNIHLFAEIAPVIVVANVKQDPNALGKWIAHVEDAYRGNAVAGADLVVTGFKEMGWPTVAPGHPWDPARGLRAVLFLAPRKDGSFQVINPRAFGFPVLEKRPPRPVTPPGFEPGIGQLISAELRQNIRDGSDPYIINSLHVLDAEEWHVDPEVLKLCQGRLAASPSLLVRAWAVHYRLRWGDKSGLPVALAPLDSAGDHDICTARRGLRRDAGAHSRRLAIAALHLDGAGL